MKFKDEQGRFLGLINIIDIIIIAVMIFLIGFVGFFYLKNDTKNPSITTQPIRYTVEFQKLNKETIDAVQEEQKVFNSSTGVYLGQVTKIEKVHQSVTIPNRELGVYEEHDVPDQSILYMTVEGKGYDTDSSIIVEGQNIKIGNEINVKGKGYAFKGYIVAIDLEEGN